ncbi:hypothetical protein JKP88DRAFT_353289 [Tribonema minus]|uniref:Uncharacterized protein n=1 Tax=Tribonema minus TaxID=303371 RepID=A0A835ZB02_9STRA|nr:hypothetical protein JKP88DRAFT_353289 [Tribonema minus]
MPFGAPQQHGYASFPPATPFMVPPPPPMMPFARAPPVDAPAWEQSSSRARSQDAHMRTDSDEEAIAKHEIDLLTAGPSCVPYSNAGGRLGDAHPDASGLGDAAQLLIECGIKCGIIENVVQALRTDTWASAERALHASGNPAYQGHTRVQLAKLSSALQAAASKQALAAIQPSDEELNDHLGTATHTFDVVEDDLVVEQGVMVGGTSRDSHNARSDLRAIVDTLITEAISDAPTEKGPAMVTVEVDYREPVDLGSYEGKIVAERRNKKARKKAAESTAGNNQVLSGNDMDCREVENAFGQVGALQRLTLSAQLLTERHVSIERLDDDDDYLVDNSALCALEFNVAAGY